MVAAALIISISPGAGAITTINNTLNYGFKRSFATILGLQMGYLAQIIIVAVGLGGIIASSATLFNIIKWIGVLYLIYLGLMQFVSSNVGFKSKKMTKEFSFKRSFLEALLINVTNPKATVFLLAFIPQFLAPSQPKFMQIMIICTTLICADFAVMSCYGMLSSTMRKRVNDPKIMRIQNRITGTALIFAAIFLSQSSNRL
jgi:homoserine/homoserine lactone efflux protein